MPEGAIYKFQPDAMGREKLEKLFVGKKRKALLKRLVKEIKRAVDNQTPRHYLIVGPRGIGKTHFLTLLYYRLREKIKDAEPAKLSEEEFSIYRVSDLLMRTVTTLGMEKIDLGRIEEMSDDDIVAALLEDLKGIGKIIVLCLENLNQIIGEQMDLRETKLLRSVLQKEDRFIVVATAPLIFPEISDHEEPFFNFFEIIYLNELTRTELKELIVKIAEIQNNDAFLKKMDEVKHKIDAIATLTGGNPRIAVLLYNLMSEEKLLEVETAFFRILDENTPYYQDVFRMLSGERRRIFDTLISIGKPATPKQIAIRTRLDAKVVNTQMRRLEKDGYVLSHKLGRTTKYEVRERLFRLWRELRREPFGRQTLSILIEFLELWYSTEQRKTMFLECLRQECIDELSLRKAGYWFLSLPAKYKEEFFVPLVKEMSKLGKMEMLEKIVPEMAVRLEARFEELSLLLKDNNFGEAVKVIDELITKYNLIDMPILWKAKGFFLTTLGPHAYKDASKAFSKALELDPKDGDAWRRKAHVLADLGKYDEAVEHISKAIELDPKNASLWVTKGSILRISKRYNGASEALSKALELDPKDGDAWRRKAHVLADLGKYDEAVEHISKAIELDPKNASLWNSKGQLLQNIKKTEEASAAFSKALSITSQITDSNPENASAWAERAKALVGLFKPEEASEAFSRASKLFPFVEHRSFFENCAWFMTGSSQILKSVTEYKKMNYGKANEHLRGVINSFSKIGDEMLIDYRNQIVMAFLTRVSELKSVEILDMVLKEIAAIEGFRKLFSPFYVALEIAKTKDTRKYYDVQLETRGIIAEIVKNLTGSTELVPEKYRKKTSRKKGG